VGLTVVHVVISLIGIGSGLVMLVGMLSGKRYEGWTAAFLATTVATSVTGFAFAADRVLPSHVVGALSLVVLGTSAYARYREELAGRWRAIYVITTVLALYLNVFVGVVQSFLKVPALRSMAPTQSEPPFVMTQLAVLALFAGLSIAAVVRFRPERTGLAHIKRMSVTQV
jgi:hypothetical protein